MRLLEASIRPSGLNGRAWVMQLEAETLNGPMRTTQHFDDMRGFLTAVQDAAVFFAVRNGKMTSEEASKRLSTKTLAANPDGIIK